jgi:exopolyphosphatase/pppGpp-phosphohydrolase
VVFVDAFHGGLLGDASVRSMVEDFLAGGTPSRDSRSQLGLRRAAAVIAAAVIAAAVIAAAAIAAAATAWRMPELRPACLPSG